MSRQRFLFASTAPGLDAVTARELAELPFDLVVGEAEPGGVAFRGDDRAMWAANLHLRTASRVLVRFASFRATSFAELERHARGLPWDTVLSRGTRVRFRVTCRKSKLYHSDAVAQRLETAVERAIGAVAVGAKSSPALPRDENASAPGERDSDDEGADAQLFIVRFLRDVCTISADSSGELLHRRGYRFALAKAPLRETLAAAMLRASGWNEASTIIDPMCGSGTIPIEAALMSRRIAPGISRSFAFERWPGYEARQWNELRAQAREQELPHVAAPIVASDRDEGAIAAARANADRAGVVSDIDFVVRPLSAIAPDPALPPGWIVTNPPYGVRVGERKPLRDLYARLGAVTRERMAGWSLALLSADRSLEAAMGLPLEERFATSNGGIPVRLMITRA